MKQKSEWLLIEKGLGGHAKVSGFMMEKMECPSKEFRKGGALSFAHCCLILVISPMMNLLVGWGVRR